MINTFSKSVVLGGELIVLHGGLVKSIFEALDGMRRLLLLDMRVVDSADLLAFLGRGFFNTVQFIFNSANSEIFIV